MTFGEKIQKLRKEAGWSQEEFADRLEVSRQAVSKWERDSGYPETEKIIKMSRMFNVSVDYLLGDEDLTNEGKEAHRSERGFYVSRETADGFLGYHKRKMQKIGLAAGLFVGGMSFSFSSEEMIDIGMQFFMVCVIAAAVLLFSAKTADNQYRRLWKEPLLFDKTVNAEINAAYAEKKGKIHAVGLIGIALIAAGFLLCPLIASAELEKIDNIIFACGMIMAGAGTFMCIYGTGMLRAYRLLISNEEYCDRKGIR